MCMWYIHICYNCLIVACLLFTALNTSANITVQSSGTAVRFFFGSEVLVPISNTSESDKKCFEVGLLFTVSNSFVTHGERFSYSAYTETDLGVRSTTQNNTLLVCCLPLHQQALYIQHFHYSRIKLFVCMIFWDRLIDSHSTM